MVASKEEEDDIILIKEVFHQPPEKKLVRIMSRVMTEDNELKYVVVWSRQNELFCTLERITNVLEYKIEIQLLQAREMILDKFNRSFLHKREKFSQLNEIFPTTLHDLEQDFNISQLDYWRIKRLELLWLRTIRRYEIDSLKRVKTAPLYIEGWHRSMYSNIPNFKYIINGYALSKKALSNIKFMKSKKRTNNFNCECCACEKGCIRCENTKGTFLKIENGLALFAECEDDVCEYFWTYECSHFCRCKTNCQYKMLKKGRKISLIVTFHSNKGWILRTLEPIKKGQFITEFLGEIITADEASERSTNYQMVMERGFYLDCEPYGNESRFISHSCDPNAAVVRIFGVQDSFVFRMAVVAKKDMQKGTEITIDYHPGAGTESPVDGSSCFCKSKKCRKWL